MDGVRLARVEVSAGGVIHRRTAVGRLEVLLIRDGYGNWGFPKGHVEPGETRQAAALRECREETGLTRVTVETEIATSDWYFRAGGGWVHKFCDYFLLTADSAEEPRPQVAEGIRECVWLDLANAAARITYDNARHILGRAVTRAEQEAGQSEVVRRRGK
jgi:8-oxo-dGTP pyrophosphatase MutT (NUDIX family)